MFGWTINLLMDIQDSDINQKQKLQNLVWSSYDRLHIRKINEFEDFFSMEDDIVKWSGSIQSLHLYNNVYGLSNLEIREKSDQKFNDLFYNVEKPSSEYALALIVSLKINETVFSQSNNVNNKYLIDGIINEARRVIGSDPIDYFFSLGEEDLVLISLSNSVDQFMKLITKLRSLSFKYQNKSYAICELTNSFLIQNCVDYSDNVECDISYASVNIALKEGVSESEFLKELNEKVSLMDIKPPKPAMAVGEYDIVINLFGDSCNCEIINLYSEKNSNNIFNANSRFYKKYIKNSKTVWCVKSNVKPKFKKKHLKVKIMNTESIHSDDYSLVNEAINDLLVELNNKAINNVDNTQYAYYNVIYFLKEASLTLNSTTNKQWKYIVSQQISAFIDNYKTFNQTMESEKYSDEFENHIYELNELINDMRNSFYHINRSHEMFYHIPTTSLHYSGSFNSILMAYYRFINEILDLTFRKPHSKNTNQAKIVYLVYFGMTSKIQQKTYLSDYSDPNETKIVGFELPYTALYDIKKYFISLTHEIYHLVAPYDRKNRNKEAEKLWTQYYIKEEFINIVCQYLGITDDSIYYKELLKCVEAFFNSNNIIYKCSTPNSDLLSLKILNSNIVEQTDILSSNELKEYFEKEYSNFKEYCLKLKKSINKKDKDNAVLIEFLNIVKSVNNIASPLTEQILYNYERKRNIETLISNITESICDNFMCQMSFDANKKPKEKYLIYMLNFFRERKIDYNNNEDAKMRFALFIDYNGMDLDSVELAPEIVDNLKKIFSEYCWCYSMNIRKIIKSIIAKDDFIRIILHCCDLDSRNKILELQKRIKQQYIVNFSNKFEEYINVINSLNVPFILSEPNPIKTIKPLKQYNEILSKEESTYVLMTTKYAQNLDDYLRIIKESSENNNGKELWYRGICNHKYHIVPSIFVNLPKGKIPYCYQLALMQECYSSTKKYYQVFAKHETPVAARQSLMQHYGVPTNLLDFSTDPLSSLFWALNPSAKLDRNDNHTAAVYIFDPYEYIEATNFMKKQIGCDIELKSHLYPIRSHDSLDDEYIIHTMEDNKIIDILGKYNEIVKTNITSVEEYNKERFNKMPIPIVIPQKNNRIIAQSGTFLAYNLLTLPELDCHEGPYDYIALDQIHKEYVQMCLDKNIRPIHASFLQRILIAPHCLSEIRYTLNKTFNYSIDSVYPDLENLLKDVKKKVYGYKK